MLGENSEKADTVHIINIVKFVHFLTILNAFSSVHMDLYVHNSKKSEKNVGVFCLLCFGVFFKLRNSRPSENEKAHTKITGQ